MWLTRALGFAVDERVGTCMCPQGELRPEGLIVALGTRRGRGAYAWMDPCPCPPDHRTPLREHMAGEVEAEAGADLR